MLILRLIISSSCLDADQVSARVVLMFEFPALNPGGGTEKSIADTSIERFCEVSLALIAATLLFTSGCVVDVVEFSGIGVGFGGRPRLGRVATTASSRR